jgi:predicted DNA-binding protein YlxM (UPF0122 family)
VNGIPNPALQAERAQLFRAGWTMEEIAVHQGVSRQMVQKAIKKAGLSKHDGGKQAQVAERELAQHKERVARMRRVYGHDATDALIQKCRRDGSLAKYVRVKNSAASGRAGCPIFSLTLSEYLQLVKNSGLHYSEGVVARTDTTLPFTLANCVFATRADAMRATAQRMRSK